MKMHVIASYRYQFKKKQYASHHDRITCRSGGSAPKGINLWGPITPVWYDVSCLSCLAQSKVEKKRRKGQYSFFRLLAKIVPKAKSSQNIHFQFQMKIQPKIQNSHAKRSFWTWSKINQIFEQQIIVKKIFNPKWRKYAKQHSEFHFT